MTSIKNIKVALLGVFTLFLFVWLALGLFTTVFQNDGVNEVTASTVAPSTNPDDFVGSETCKACHEDQFKSVASTKHGKLSQMESWKDKVQGCESCHGGGKAHSEEPSAANIISFKNKNSKEISETCLGCHAGKESHNNFRRGEHWRNNVGCTECHTAHGPDTASFKAGSITSPSETSRENPSEATFAMLKKSEPQLCISCHSETKAQFGKPFHHKVLEGTMKCSDCHNAHGGFDAKQTKLAVGTEAACVKCHTDKQGPFVFEHAPLKAEGCATCHSSHGSANPKMLKRPQVRQLCLECHSGITNQLSDGPTGGPHSQTSIRSQNCTVCHSAIHGSNTSNVFFR
jgi:predicted CXXCH cytochrome family protein